MYDTVTPLYYPLSLHDALPIYERAVGDGATEVHARAEQFAAQNAQLPLVTWVEIDFGGGIIQRKGWLALTTLRSEEHTSELQSLAYLVCRLLLEKKKTKLAYVH